MSLVVLVDFESIRPVYESLFYAKIKINFEVRDEDSARTTGKIWEIPMITDHLYTNY